MHIHPQDIRHQAGASAVGLFAKTSFFTIFNYEATRRDFPAIRLTQFRYVQFRRAANGDVRAPATAAQCTTAINMIKTRNFGTVSRTVVQDLALAGSITLERQEHAEQ